MQQLDHVRYQTNKNMLEKARYTLERAQLKHSIPKDDFLQDDLMELFLTWD